MAQFRTIEIDFDVHKRIEAERQGFDDTPNDALRRLLKLGPADKKTQEPKQGGRVIDLEGRPWRGKGVTLPHGTPLQMEYNRTVHDGVIDDGEWSVEGKRFKSPSAAAGGVAVTKKGNHTSLDGWIYWKAKLPGDDRWTPIKALKNPF